MRVRCVGWRVMTMGTGCHQVVPTCQCGCHSPSPPSLGLVHVTTVRTRQPDGAARYARSASSELQSTFGGACRWHRGDGGFDDPGHDDDDGYGGGSVSVIGLGYMGRHHWERCWCGCWCDVPHQRQVL